MGQLYVPLLMMIDNNAKFYMTNFTLDFIFISSYNQSQCIKIRTDNLQENNSEHFLILWFFSTNTTLAYPRTQKPEEGSSDIPQDQSYTPTNIDRYTAQKMKFSIKEFFSKFEQIRKKLQIWSHLLKKPLIESQVVSVESSPPTCR